MKKFSEFVNESANTYIVIAVVDNGSAGTQPVAKQEVSLTKSQEDKLMKLSTKEKIQGEEWIVVKRESYSKLGFKLPQISAAGRTSGYDKLLFTKK